MSEPGGATAVTPRIMGVINASLDSLVGGVDAEAAADLGAGMVAAGASILDCGGQSLRTDQSEISVAEELDRVLPVIAAVAARCPRATISVDTYRAATASAAIAQGATLVNDPSGLLDPEMAGLVADAGVEVVLAYSRATPKVRMTRDALAQDPIGDGIAFLGERCDVLLTAGVAADRIVIDPGPDLGKSPEQTIEVLHRAGELRAALGGVRVLWAVSKKDFVGALVGRRPSERGPGTFGALAALDLEPGDIVRVHDVSGVADFFAVRAAVANGYEGVLDLAEDLRYDV